MAFFNALCGGTPINHKLLRAAAASAGHEGAVQCLLQAGADVNARTKMGRNALHYAASKGHARVTMVLIEAGRASLPTHTITGAAYWTCLCCCPGELRQAHQIFVPLQGRMFGAWTSTKAHPYIVRVVLARKDWLKY
jgi:hypothetical protein